MLRLTLNFLAMLGEVPLARQACAAPRHFQNAITILRAAGVQKIIFAEQHSAPHNLEIMTQMLARARLAADGPVHIWEESGRDPAEPRSAELIQAYNGF